MARSGLFVASVLAVSMSLTVTVAAPRQGSVTGYREGPNPSSDTQALICSQIVNVLPYTTFRRQYMDAWTVCKCTSYARASCTRDRPLREDQPTSPSEEDADPVRSSPEFKELLSAFSVQQFCFLNVLRSKKCAFSWEKGSRPACDCAQKMDMSSGEQMIAEKKKLEIKDKPIIVHIPDSAFFQDRQQKNLDGDAVVVPYAALQEEEERLPAASESAHLRSRG